MRDQIHKTDEETGEETEIIIYDKELVIRNYDEQTRPFGRARKSFTDWITEYNYVSEKSLSKEEFLKIINEKEKPTGLDYEPIKVKLTYGDGKVYYRHILKTATF